MPDTKQNLAPEILTAIIKAIDDVNELLAPENRLARSREAALVGPDAVLDSMAFVNLIAAVEERIEATFGAPISLADMDVGNDMQAFRTVGTLADYVSRIVASIRAKTETAAPNER